MSPAKSRRKFLERGLLALWQEKNASEKSAEIARTRSLAFALKILGIFALYNVFLFFANFLIFSGLLYSIINRFCFVEWGYGVNMTEKKFGRAIQVTEGDCPWLIELSPNFRTV